MQLEFSLSRFLLLIAALATWLMFVFFTAFAGWWMSPVAGPDESASFFSWASKTLERENAAGNSALVLIEDGKVVSQFYRGASGPVDADTVFSTASMSKWVAAHGIMQAAIDRRARTFPARHFSTAGAE